MGHARNGASSADRGHPSGLQRRLDHLAFALKSPSCSVLVVPFLSARRRDNLQSAGTLKLVDEKGKATCLHANMRVLFSNLLLLES